MGTVNAPIQHVVVKIIGMPRGSLCATHARKLDSFNTEVNFYSRGCADGLRKSGIACPSLVYFHRGSGLGSMSALSLSSLDGMRLTQGMAHCHVLSALAWLAKFHAAFWGARADNAIQQVGLQAQGCFWHLDCR